jgi:cytochrome P450
MLAQIIASALTGFAVLAVFIYHLQQQRNASERRNGCDPVTRHRPKEPFFGFDFRKGMHVDIPFLYRFHQRYGKTFQLSTLIAQPAIITIDPANIRVVNTAKEYGVEPARLSGMEYFCGRGFLTTDGELWQHSRKMLKPGFAKSNLMDLDFLSRQVDDLLTRLPAEGETIDLQPLFYTMVS